MKKEEFLKLLQARLVERGVPENAAEKETEHVRTYLSESGMEDLELEVDEMADGIIAMLDDSAETEGEISITIAAPADSESESVSDELSAAIAAMDADADEHSGEKAADEPLGSDGSDNALSDIPIVFEPDADSAEEALPEVDETPVFDEPVPAEGPEPEILPEEACSEEKASMPEDPQPQNAENIEEDPAEEIEPAPEEVSTVPSAPETQPAHAPAPSQDIDEEDMDIEEFIPYDKKRRMKNNAKQKNNNEWLYVTLLVITIPIAIALILIAFTLYLGFWVILALAMIACVAVLIVFVTVGAIVSLVGIVYGVVQLITGLVPVGLFEVGLGIIIGAVVMFVGILVYNFAVRFIPFGMKLLAKLFSAGFRGIRSGYQSLKGAVASL